MKVHRPDARAGELADPLSTVWSALEAEVVELKGAPLDAQPSRYIREAYAGESVGATERVEVKIAEHGGRLFVHLAWEDAHEDRSHHENAFPDAAAVMFPLSGDARLDSMGSADQPVALWYWRPDLEDEADELVAGGLGTVEPASRNGASTLSARSDHDGHRWSVVLSRETAGGEDHAELGQGGASQVAFAVWEGSVGERGGFKSTSDGWKQLEWGGEG